MVDQRMQAYCWTEDLNAAFYQRYGTQSEANGAGAVGLIRKLTGWPWHVCRTQACLLGLVKTHISHEWTAELDEILEIGYRTNGRAKQEAIERIQAKTGWPRHVCWNRARKLALVQVHPKRWTQEEDKVLLDFVSSKSLREIAKRLKRTVAAVRKRLLQLGGERKLSARVTDGHTKSELSQYLGCSRKTIQRWIDEGLLKGRYEGRNRPDDTLRITDEDFRAFWKKHPWEVPLFRLNHEGLLWFCSVMFDIPPNDYFGDPLDRRQRRLNFQMSVKNLYQSFEDRERVPKIQGLLNECMTFLDDELSLVTGPYEDLLSIDEVIQNELILFVSLNINKNTEPVRALGKMLLQNLQLVIGKRYENQHSPELSKRPLVSVVLDEFAPFGYRNFPQIVQMARGTNTAFLFSMQSLPQLMSVGRGFKEDVSSAPNTTLCMRTRDEISAQYFIKASSQQRAVRRTLGVQRRKLLSWEQYSETGSGTFTELKETRALDEHIKNLPKGQMEVLMSDDTRGTLHGLLHVAPPPAVNFPGYEPCLPKRLDSSREGNKGACLRLKDAKLARSLKVPRTARGA